MSYETSKTASEVITQITALADGKGADKTLLSLFTTSTITYNGVDYSISDPNVQTLINNFMTTAQFPVVTTNTCNAGGGGTTIDSDGANCAQCVITFTNTAGTGAQTCTIGADADSRENAVTVGNGNPCNIIGDYDCV